MSQYWSKLVHNLDPYIPGEQPKDQRYIKLNTNECPYPPSPMALDAIEAAGGENLRLYSDPTCSSLKEAVADFYTVDPHNVFVGNGSDEVLGHVFHALLKQDKPLLYPDLSYGFYPTYKLLYEVEAIEIPLRDDFSINLNDYRKKNGGIIFANPNAPTGLAVGLDEIEALLQHNTESVVVVDEAYVDFGGTSAVPLTRKYPNLLVVQTFSKSRALAGLRVGIAVGDQGLIDGLERVKGSFHPYTLGRMELAGAAASMRDRAHLAENCNKVIKTREAAVEQLREVGFTVLPSKTNFLFVRPPGGNAEKIYLALKAQGILVRHFSKARISEYLRISIGTDAEMAVLMDKLKVMLGEGEGRA